MEVIDMIKLAFLILSAVVIGIFLKVHLEYRKNMLKIISDLLTVYKNFFHWNISKVILNAYSWLFGLIVASPFLAITIGLLYKTAEILGTENIKLLSVVITSGDIGAIIRAFSGFGIKGIWFLVSLIGVLLVVSVVIFAFMYSYFLLQNVYRNYLEGKKLKISKWSSISAITFALVSIVLSLAFGDNPYIFIGSVLGAGILASPFFIFGILKSENEYLNYRLIWKFLGVSSWTALYLIAPSLLLMVILYLPQYGPITALIEAKNIIVLTVYILLFLATFIYFIYMCIRLIFTNLTLLDDARNHSRHARDFVRESLAITKGKALRITALSVPFILISLVLTELTNYIDALNQFAPILTGTFDFLFISGIGFMILNSLYGIFNAREYEVVLTPTDIDDNGLAIIEAKEAKASIKPIIGSPSPEAAKKDVSKKPITKKKLPAKKPVTKTKSK